MSPASADSITITGHVTRSSGGSAGAGVTVIAKDYSDQEIARATTDDRGAYSMTDVDGDMVAWVCAVQDVPAAERTLAGACVDRYSLPTADLAMDRVTTVGGVVTLGAGGVQPTPMTAVLYQAADYDYDTPWVGVHTAPIDPDSGRFLLTEVRDGNYRLCAVHIADDDLSSEELVGCAGGPQIEDGDDVLPRGAALAKSFTVPPPGRLSVSPSRLDGSTARGSVAVYRVVPDGRGGVRRAFAPAADRGDAGSHSFSLAPGRYRVLFSPEQESGLLPIWNGGAVTFDAAPDVVVAAGGRTSLDLAAPAAATISGRVSVVGSMTSTPSVRVVNTSTGAAARVEQDPENQTFSATGLRPGRYRVEFARNGGERYAATFYAATPESAGIDAATLVDLASGEDATGIDGSVGSGRVTTGQVRDVTGKPIQGARVTAYTDDDRLVSRSTETDDQGRFTVAGLQEGSYKFSVDAEDADHGRWWYLGATGPLTTDRSTARERAVGEAGLALGTLRLGGGPPSEPPLIRSRPTISGTATPGSTLTASPGTWSESGLSFSYKWVWKDEWSEARPVEGAIGRTYAPTARYAGRQLAVQVFASRAGLKEGYARSDWTDPVGAPTVKGLSTPTLSRSEPVVGQTLSVSGGTWSPVPTSTTYQWYRGDATIKGATSASYVPIAADAGERLAVVEVVRRAGYAPGSVKLTAAALTVAAGAQPSVVNLVRPTITGTPYVGRVLTASPGSWNVVGSTYAYAWLANGTPIPGATRSTFVPTSEQLYASLSVRVTATRTGYRAGVADSDEGRSVFEPQVNTVRPVITGTPQVDSTLTASEGRWSRPFQRYTYQWYAGTTAIPGATSATYRVSWRQVGQALSVEVTARSQGEDPVAASSLASARVALASLRVLSPPTISGSGAVGTALTYQRATVSPWSARFSVEWLRNGVPIGATGPTYIVTAADRGATIAARATSRLPGYVPISLTTAGIVVPTT